MEQDNQALVSVRFNKDYEALFVTGYKHFGADAWTEAFVARKDVMSNFIRKGQEQRTVALKNCYQYAVEENWL
ncbi:hypothetical protein B003_03055 [Vibrio breoganii 1C10]|nr:hypothetical protein B003_03055 [Vibrio breoganii 1C10]